MLHCCHGLETGQKNTKMDDASLLPWLEKCGNAATGHKKWSQGTRESPPEFAVDGNEGSAGVLGDGDLLPGAGHHGVGARVECGGEDQPSRHVAQQRGSQQVRHRQQLLLRGQGSLVGRRSR